MMVPFKGDFPKSTIDSPKNCQNYEISFASFSVSFCPKAFGKMRWKALDAYFQKITKFLVLPQTPMISGTIEDDLKFFNITTPCCLKSLEIPQ